MQKLIKNLAMYICMFVAVFCAMALKAEAANVTSGTLGDNNGISWTYDVDSKTMTIAGEDCGLNGTWDSTKSKYKSPFADICKDVEVIKVQNCTLKGSAKAMFANLGTLKSVEFSNVDTSGVTDMIEMFSGCSSLSSLDVSKFDTSNVTSMRGMFYNCRSLSSLDLIKFNTSKVTDMSYMFYGCSKLSSLDVSKFATSNVTNMYGMFYNCSNLSSLDVSKFNTSKVTDMSYMFYGCSKLSSLDVSKFNTPNVTGMRSMFCNCSNLSSLDVSGFDTSKVTNMGSMFSSCSGLSSLDVSGFDTSKVTNMGSMFSSCSSLSSLDVSKFNTSKVTDMSFMFQGCSSLSSLDVSKFDTSKVTDMSTMFNYCKSLSSLDVSGFDTSKVTNMGSMFSSCSSLSSLDVSGFDTSKVTNMGSMFSSCSSLSSLDVSKFDTSNVTYMGSMFAGCRSLSSLDVSGFDTSKVTDMSYMFYYCRGLSSLDLSGFNLTKVIGKNSFLSGCTGLAFIETPKTMPETMSIDLPGTYANPEGKRTTKIAKDFSGTTLIHVNYLVSEIKLNFSSLTVDMGKTAQLSATISPEKAINKTVTWESSDTAVATVDENGKVSAVAAGSANITATATDGSGVGASCEVTVTRVMSEQERQVRAFVERMYTIVLGRAAEEQGLNDWSARLMAKEIDGATLVDMFVNSDEFINRNINDEEYIKILYRAVLGREADADGLKMWKDMLADDWTRDYILEGLVLSTEFKNICDSYGIIAAFDPTAESQVRNFVKRMYTVVLNRRADAVGLDDWTRHLMNGSANGAQLADGFISSDEFVNRNLSNEKYIKVLYRAFFNREPDEGGFNVWMNELAKGVSRRDVMKGFVHSVEFSDLCAAYGIIRGEIQ